MPAKKLREFLDNANDLIEKAATLSNRDLTKHIETLRAPRAGTPNPSNSGVTLVRPKKRSFYLFAEQAEIVEEALAEAGRHQEAARAVQRALGLLPANAADLRAEYDGRLALYRSGRPFHHR